MITSSFTSSFGYGRRTPLGGTITIFTTFFGENTTWNISSSAAGAPLIACNEFKSHLSNIKIETLESIGFLEADTFNINFSGPSGNIPAEIVVLNPGAAPIHGIYNDGGFEGRSNTTPGGNTYFDTDASFYIDFGSNTINAFGFYVTDVGDYYSNLSIMLTDTSDVNSQVIYVEHSGSGDSALIFWGFIDPTKQYKRVTFYNLQAEEEVFGDSFGFDDFVIGTIP